jgi:hypothetical protein
MNRVSICLSDIPREKLKKATNGKIYVNLIVAERREPDQFGNDLTVYVDQTKEEREVKAEKTYIGAGRNYSFSPANTSPDSVNDMPPITDSDPLPY